MTLEYDPYDICSAFVGSKMDILNVARCKYSLHKFRENVLL